MRSSFLLFALVTQVAACSSSTPATTDSGEIDHDAMDMDTTEPVEDTAPSETSSGAAATIHVGNFYYNPKTVTVKVGETVEWIWDGGTHTVTSGSSCTSDKKWDSGVHSTAKYKFTHKFTEAGTFPFFCDFMDHCTSKGQEGTVTVTP